jgi:hypothetical protein
MAVKRSKGHLRTLLRGQKRWYPVESVAIERPKLCPTGACDLHEDEIVLEDKLGSCQTY